MDQIEHIIDLKQQSQDEGRGVAEAVRGLIEKEGRMTTAHKLSIVALAVLILALVVGSVTATYLVMDARLRQAVAETKVNGSQELVKAAQKTIDEAKSSIAKRDQDFAEWRTQHAKDVAAVRTAAQAANALNTEHNVGLEATSDPDSPGAVKYTLPIDKVIPLYQQLAVCDEKSKALGICEADKVDLNKQIGGKDSQLSESKKQVDTLTALSKGGTKTQRLWFALKVGACGAAGAGVGSISKKPGAAAVGGAITSSFCAITLRK